MARGERLQDGAAPQVAIYSCTFLDYDDVYTPIGTTPGATHVLISDRRPRFVRRLSWRPLPPETSGMRSNMANRWCKFFPHRLFPEADVSVYIDGNILLLNDLTPLIAEFLDSGAAIGLFPHNQRGSIEEEAAAFLATRKAKPGDAETVARQIAAYRAEGLPQDRPLTENAVILRRHNHPGLDAAMTLWWSEMEQGLPRDQISLPWVLHCTGLPARIWDWTYKTANPYFLRYPHRRSMRRRIRTWFQINARRGPAAQVVFGAGLAVFAVTAKLVARLGRRNDDDET